MSRPDYVSGKTIIVTGAASGFGRLISEKAAARGASIVCADINADVLENAVSGIQGNGGTAMAYVANVTDAGEMAALAQATVDAYGSIDVMINNAGVMPLAFFSDHKEALDRWHQCIDINIKGVLNGMVAVYDQMLVQGGGHIINMSSIYGNFPVAGAAVYGATKAAVNFLSESMRVESAGKIKVTRVKPTGVPATGLAGSVVNPEAIIGIAGHNAPAYLATVTQYIEGSLPESQSSVESIGYAVLDPEVIAEEVIHAIDQPPGVTIGDVSVRASGDQFIL